jgi:hypothetical protein
LQIPAVAAKIDATAGSFDVSGQFSPGVVHYRLDGVQTDCFEPKLLGSSIIEGKMLACR